MKIIGYILQVEEEKMLNLEHSRPIMHYCIAVFSSGNDLPTLADIFYYMHNYIEYALLHFTLRLPLVQLP